MTYAVLQGTGVPAEPEAILDSLALPSPGLVELGFAQNKSIGTHCTVPNPRTDATC